MDHAIWNRRSIRSYLDTPVSREAVEQVLQAGILAPSSKNRQPWKFIVVAGKPKQEMLDAMRRGLAREEECDVFLPGSRQHLSGAWNTLRIMEQAPVTVFVINRLGESLLNPLTPEKRVSEICNTLSIGAAMENMALEATRLGLGSLWICDIFFAYQELSNWLNVEGTLAAAMTLGVADEQPPPRPRRKIEDTVEWRDL